jgi:hypothetical protein
MFPSSAIRAIEQSGSLVVVCPPFYVAAAFSFGLAAVMFLTTWIVAGRDLGALGTLILFASQLPFLLISAGLATTGASAILDSQAGLLHVRSRVFGIAIRQNSLPLSSVEAACIQTGKGTQRLAFQLKDGSSVPLGFFTNQPGRAAAAQVINRFLHDQTRISAAPDDPTPACR